MSKDTKTPRSAIDLYKVSVDLIKKHANYFIVLSVIPALLSSLLSIKNDDSGMASVGPYNLNLSTNRVSAALGVGFILALLLLLAFVVVSIMAQVLYLRAAQNQKYDYSSLFAESKKIFFRYLGVSIVSALAFIGGLILFIIPGIIALRRYILAPFVLIDKNMGVLDSMSESARITKEYSKSVYALLGVTLVLAIVSTIFSESFGAVGILIGAFIALGYSFAPAIRYVELKKLSKK